MPVASAIFYIAVGAMAGSLDFSFSPEIGGTSKMQSMHSDFGPAVVVAIISTQSNQGGRKLRGYFHLPVAMNNAGNQCDAKCDVAKCQQAVHGPNIASFPEFGKREISRFVHMANSAALTVSGFVSSERFCEIRAKKSPPSWGASDGSHGQVNTSRVRKRINAHSEGYRNENGIAMITTLRYFQSRKGNEH